MKIKNIQLVQTTTSLSSRALLRDGIYILLSQIFKKKVIVFFRGWDYNFVKKISGLRFSVFKYIYFKTDALIDLSNENKQHLLNWGYDKSIYVESTVFDDSIENAVTIESITQKFSSASEKTNILFLARVEKEKVYMRLLKLTQTLIIIKLIIVL
ncbi:MAG: hypothetical protein IPJ23_05875 [Ignavibacteriales bacterium]|nr:hypothetical protein [Ignavibacteriales bacterium]